MTVTIRIDSLKTLVAAAVLAALGISALGFALRQPLVPGTVDISGVARKAALFDVEPQVGPADTLNNESQTTSQPSTQTGGAIHGPSATVNHEGLPSGSGGGGTVINKVKKGATYAIVVTGAQGHVSSNDPVSSKEDDTSNTTSSQDTTDDDITVTGVPLDELLPLP